MTLHSESFIWNPLWQLACTPSFLPICKSLVMSLRKGEGKGVYGKEEVHSVLGHFVWAYIDHMVTNPFETLRAPSESMPPFSSLLPTCKSLVWLCNREKVMGRANTQTNKKNIVFGALFLGVHRPYSHSHIWELQSPPLTTGLHSLHFLILQSLVTPERKGKRKG